MQNLRIILFIDLLLFKNNVSVTLLHTIYINYDIHIYYICKYVAHERNGIKQ